MDWEYVVLSCWDIVGPAVDEHFITQYASLQSQGWEEFIRAPWQIGREHASGAVIMRRPKTEPQERETRDKLYNKYCVTKEDGSPVDPDAQYFVLRLDTDECARQAAAHYAFCCESKGIQRGLSRDLHQLVSRLGRAADERPKDEPRKWTERRELQKRNAELQGRLSERQETIEALTRKIAVMSQPGPRADGGWLGPPSPGPVLNERAMQANFIGRLERCNAVLRNRLSSQKEALQMQNRRIEGLQRELALTKEETNG